ncbi:MAG TPA: riboflavin synthase [Candidatus Nitrosopolaris sp.]|nr:riboflavin synthase [Candidatus Nitrosopolaris sp.]
MFTGIIRGLAEVKSISKINSDNKSADTKLCINLGRKLKEDLKVGDSLSINGTCLTATRISKTVDFEIINETMNRTCLGLLKDGDKVNVERSLRLSDRLDGHFLLGHVDGIGVIKKIIKSPTQTKVWIRIQNKKLMSWIVPKGSIAIDGVSLTIVDIEDKKKTISVTLIPHTLATTTLTLKSIGERVNVETDIIGKYLSKQLPVK